MHKLSLAFTGDEIKHRIDWFITIRWLAVILLFLVITGVSQVVHIDLPLNYLYFGNITLAFFNLLFLLYSRRLNRETNEDKLFTKASRFTNLQIAFDLLVLTYLLHFAGSIENPFIFYFMFHIIIASILLTNRAAYFQATLAVGMLGVLVLVEYLGVVRHYHLSGFISSGQIMNPVYILGVFFVFITTIYLTVYMATSIVNKLRQGEIALAEANEKIAEQDRLKSRYVATVSHDLQAPLASIQGCLKVVIDGLTGDVSPKSQEMISRAEQKTLHLLYFVKELLDLSRIKAARELDMEYFNFTELFRDVLEQFKIKAQANKLSIETQFDVAIPYITANKYAIEKMLMNLIGNSIKYTPAGGKIGATIQRSTKQSNAITGEIWDTGIGIPLEEQKSIFDEFYRAKNAKQLVIDGTGLGLSIVAEVIKAHHGEIALESEAGKGSRFKFTLPVNN